MDPKLIVNGKEYPLPDSFTLGESADMEEITGQGYDLSKGGARGLLALAYVAVRRVDSSITVDDIRELTDADIDVKQLEPEAPLPPATPADSKENGGPSDASSKPDSEPPTV